MLLSCLALLGFGCNKKVAPHMPIPTPQQLDWQEAELLMFIHFGINTFTDREWGDGTEDPSLFNPVKLDARQWVSIAKETGFKYIILTAKHHDGFCLWPSKYTEHSVKNSPWKDGNGDVVREFVDACHEAGIKVGLYLSPWDRNAQCYGDSPKYNQFYKNQLTELLTNYGDVAEVWFDGACGEGPNGKKQEYDWQGYFQVIRTLQPKALIAISGPDIRWVGNEDGVARETEWSVQPPHPVRHFGIKDDVWNPAECDVSIRPGWFWHEADDSKVKSLDHLLDIYYKSVGRNSVMLLNVPPNNQGLFAEEDIQRLKELRAVLDESFKVNLAAGKHVQASSVRASGKKYSAQNIADENPATFWTTHNEVTNGWLEIDFGEDIQFNVVKTEEMISLGQRVESYRIDIWNGTDWQTIKNGTTIGHKKLDRVEPVTTSKVRFVIEKARACPIIREFGLYLASNTGGGATEFHKK
ncbi:alpha-L-fucosidase [candidate division KSB1 bacterium]|nr:alpha-L-fucosidase [candidate division KSB1 bacterium]